jgi:hypothetical protein
MAVKLQNNPTIRTLAHDLGVRISTDPVTAIKGHCHQQVKQFLKEFKDCTTLTGLLALAAQKLGTTFRDVHSDADLQALVKEFAARKEPCAAFFEPELTHDVYGITFKLLNAGKFDLPYISVIDCRGSKIHRAYFTKWHELGHLLILTDQRRFAFKRTHALHEIKSPEESMVDVIAGEFAYYEPMVRPYVKGDLTFEAIDTARQALCPEGSYLSALFGLVKVWPVPCLLVEAKWATRRSGEESALRAVHVVINDLARADGLQLHKHFRVPKRSVIHQAFDGSIHDGTAVEDLDWWQSSDGTQLQEQRIQVSTKRIGDTVYALMIPV